ncbi:hypothetical protein F5B21DRAFT_487371 [Xylaria acuta]|nr:hypothetical protein F5B21DRAFT_487371 [Xylaria acuta]
MRSIPVEDLAAAIVIESLPNPAAQQPSHLFSKAELPQSMARAVHGMPAETLAKPLAAPKQHPRQKSSGAAVSLRGGGFDSGRPQRKKHQPETSQPHAPLAQPPPMVGSNGAQEAPTPTPTRAVFPGLAKEKPPPTAATTKRKIAYFNPPFTSFQTLPFDVQLSTLSYLRGQPATDWARDLGLPLLDMFRHLRCCVLLFCEDENPALPAVLRDPVAYARFRDGLNPNFLAPDDDFVQSVRGRNPCLDARLKNPHQRWRIVLAFRTVDFPAVMEGKGEEAMSGGEDRDEEKMRDDSLGLGDLDMTT